MAFVAAPPGRSNTAPLVRAIYHGAPALLPASPILTRSLPPLSGRTFVRSPRSDGGGGSAGSAGYGS